MFKTSCWQLWWQWTDNKTTPHWKQETGSFWFTRSFFVWFFCFFGFLLCVFFFFFNGLVKDFDWKDCHIVENVEMATYNSSWIISQIPLFIGLLWQKKTEKTDTLYFPWSTSILKCESRYFQRQDMWGTPSPFLLVYLSRKAFCSLQSYSLLTFTKQVLEQQGLEKIRRESRYAKMATEY